MYPKTGKRVHIRRVKYPKTGKRAYVFKLKIKVTTQWKTISTGPRAWRAP